MFEARESLGDKRELSSLPGLGGRHGGAARVGRQRRRLHLSASSQHWHLWKAGSEGATVARRTLSPGFFFSPTPIPRALIRGGSKKALVPCSLPGGLRGKLEAQIRVLILNSQCACSVQACAARPAPALASQGNCRTGCSDRQILGEWADLGEQPCYLRQKASPLEEAHP